MRGQIFALPRLDAVVRSLVSAPRMSVVVSVVDERVLDASAVGFAQQLGAAIGGTQNEVAVAKAVESLDALEPGGLESRNRAVKALLIRRADDDQSHKVSFRRAARRSGIPSCTISSTGAS